MVTSWILLRNLLDLENRTEKNCQLKLYCFLRNYSSLLYHVLISFTQLCVDITIINMMTLLSMTHTSSKDQSTRPLDLENGGAYAPWNS